MDEEIPGETLTQHLVCGALGGLVADMCVHPFDTIRTRLQVQGSSSVVSNQRYRHTGDAIVKIFSREGFRAFYKGFGAVAAFTIPSHALYFATYERVNQMLRPSVKSRARKGALVHFASGFAADMAGALLWTPQDVIKQRVQLQSRGDGSGVARAGGSWQCFRGILANEGFGGLWKGYWAGIAVYGPFVGIYFLTYEDFKLRALRWFGVAEEKHLSSLTFAVGGAYGGALAAVVTCPMDIIKTRIQVGIQYASWKDALTRMVRSEGYAALFNGVGARVLWIAPGTAITIAAYEKLKIAFFHDG